MGREKTKERTGVKKKIIKEKKRSPDTRKRNNTRRNREKVQE